MFADEPADTPNSNLVSVLRVCEPSRMRSALHSLASFRMHLLAFPPYYCLEIKTPLRQY